MLEDCDFENGLCPGWYQSYTDDFDWTRRSGPTGSYRTGPSSGHGGYGEFVVYINPICIFNLKGIFSLAKYCSDFTSRSWRWTNGKHHTKTYMLFSWRRQNLVFNLWSVLSVVEGTQDDASCPKKHKLMLPALAPRQGSKRPLFSTICWYFSFSSFIVCCFC